MTTVQLTRRQLDVLAWVDWSHTEGWGEFCPLHASEIAENLQLAQSFVEKTLAELIGLGLIYPRYMTVPSPKWAITETGRLALQAAS